MTLRKALILAALGVSACTSPTEILILVDSNYSVPSELSAVEVEVKSVAGSQIGIRNFALPGEPLPLSLAVVPEDGDPAKPVRIYVRGKGPRGVLIERQFVLRFSADEIRLLPVYLDRACEARSCPLTATCSERGCVPIITNVEELAVIEPGDEKDHRFRPGDAGSDGGPRDAGGRDAAWPDVGPPPDAGPLPEVCRGANATLLVQDSVTFDEARVGERVILRVPVLNDGSSPLCLTSIDVPHGADTYSVSPRSLGPIAPGESSEVEVEFAPEFAGIVFGELRFASNDAGAGVLVVPLSGTAIDPELAVTPSPPPYVFGTIGDNPHPPTIYVNQVVTALFELENVGSGGPLRLSSVTLEGDQASSFRIVDTNKIPAVLAPGQTLTLEVEFQAAAAGAFAAELVLSTNDLRLGGGSGVVRGALSAAAELCPGRPNANTSASEAGLCLLSCQARYADADEDPDTGCEYGPCDPTAPTDEPDAEGADQNCDGVDGTAATSFFVAPTGDDASAGTRRRPFATIRRALLAAASAPKTTAILVAAGEYSENAPLRVLDGVGIHGGYDAAESWLRTARSLPRLSAPGTVFELIELRKPTVVEHLNLTAERALAPGANVAAIYLRGTSDNVVLRELSIAAGAGADGQNGGAGAPGAPGLAGGPGGRGCGNQMNCLPALGRGGIVGASACGRPGGRGGNGGEGRELNGQPGLEGTGVGAGKPGDGGESADLCSQCDRCLGQTFRGAAGGAGLSAAAGDRGPPGGGGVGASASGPVWLGQSGSRGMTGSSGDGGGGGGGGGGGSQVCGRGLMACLPEPSVCAPDRGGGGGGGGGGGCGGEGGAGGQAGGASFGIYAHAAAGRAEAIRVVAGNGGKGGNGGAGGLGGEAGSGGEGGSGADDSERGGSGGGGGRGGAGGAGGGGAGGASYCVFRAEAPEFVIDGLDCTPGQGGAGGAGEEGNNQGTETHGAPGEAGSVGAAP